MKYICKELAIELCYGCKCEIGCYMERYHSYITDYIIGGNRYGRPVSNIRDVLVYIMTDNKFPYSSMFHFVATVNKYWPDQKEWLEKIMVLR